ncbi:MAG: DJ-1/PfpI family protein [Pararhodobacter sp.]
MFRTIPIFLTLGGMIVALGIGLLAAPSGVVSAGTQTEPLALRPLTAARPMVVLLADNAGTETTDLLVPHGILRRAGATDLRILSTGAGPVTLMPALSIEADQTIAAFEAQHPEGADVVIVPALHSRGTPATSAFLRRQAALGAAIVAICEGAEVVARAGLLEGRAATTHWFALRRLARRHPQTEWRRHARWIEDGPVMTSSGVSASVPVTLALLERLAGHAVAARVAHDLGVEGWDSAHNSDAFGLGARRVLLVARNLGAFWRHERLGVALDQGFDGVALALQADAWSRTYRSRVVGVNAAGRVRSAEGVQYLTEAPSDAMVALAPLIGPPHEALDAALAAIAARYGPATAEFVAVQLEYPWQAAAGAGGG